MLTAYPGMAASIVLAMAAMTTAHGVVVAGSNRDIIRKF
jgi:hypothetical protein